jgi:hypothetical protein
MEVEGQLIGLLPGIAFEETDAPPVIPVRAGEVGGEFRFSPGAHEGFGEAHPALGGDEFDWPLFKMVHDRDRIFLEPSRRRALEHGLRYQVVELLPFPCRDAGIEGLPELVVAESIGSFDLDYQACLDRPRKRVGEFGITPPPRSRQEPWIEGGSDGRGHGQGL